MDPIDRLLDDTLERIRAERARPESTYRLQFHKGFTFRDAVRLAPYLRALGITHCYASPYLKARPGSMHGYDIVNHQVLNPENGTEDDYRAWIDALHQNGLGQVLDIVPNHMGIVGNENEWWNDVLENGPSSARAQYFDIDWYGAPRPELLERVLLPVLGDTYGKVLESGQLRLAYEAGAFSLRYFDHRFPVAPGSYELILAHRADELAKTLGPQAPELMEYQSIVTAIHNLPGRTETDPARIAERQREKEVIKRRLAALEESCPAVRAFIRQNVEIFNGRPGDRHSFDLLDQLLNRQPYRLAFWRVAADEINYRRFFDVNELAALSMERPEVFAATQALILRLLTEGAVNGVRIDHPDGLYDPKQYLERLQQEYALARARVLAGERPEYATIDWDEASKRLRERVRADATDPLLARPLYVVVEKILGKDEALSPDWPVDGTSGYDFLNMLNGLYVDADNARAFTRVYDDWLGEHLSFAEVVYQKKRLILQVSLSSEGQMLARQLDRLAQKNRASRDFTFNSLRAALREIIACFPVYRSYIADQGIHNFDRLYVQTAVRRAKARNQAMSSSIFDFVRDMLLLKYPDSATDADKTEQRRFAGKFQQVTAPVMAKGLEDTAFYVYARLLSLNDVGGDPDRFGVLPAALHRYNQDRRERWPYSLSATSTHDTKRSQDVRARINALSELPDDWRAALERWSKLNDSHAIRLEEQRVPDRNEEYFFYQTLLGAWPLEPYEPAEYERFVARIHDYMQKAMHEAKVHTSWINPDPAFDDALRQFIGRVLDPSANQAFLDDFRAFQRPISHYGLFSSLSQTLLKIASPGVPDFYQGTELWDFSLVDPDNRRPVDYDIRQRLLKEIARDVEKAGGDRACFARSLVESRHDGRIKLYTIREALECGRQRPGLFSAGEYLPVEASGPAAASLFGFVRRHKNTQAVVAVPRLLTRVMRAPDTLPLGHAAWNETALLLPAALPDRRYRNLFTGEVFEPWSHVGRSALAAADLFANFPVALLVAD
jgi:(1->4)-alpha-D-glucan 1-alpha-D-glucosylmutase